MIATLNLAICMATSYIEADNHAYSYIAIVTTYFSNKV